jgi:2-iminobutanoate/2-iminopropanoate deaminase
MPKKTTYVKRQLEKDFNFCQAVRAGQMLFISGCISWDDEGKVLAPGDWDVQVRNVYEELRSTLAHFGLGFSDVVKETIYCRSMDSMVAAAPVRANALGDNEPFASTWVEISRLVDAGLLLEVEMTAVFPD